jgi:ribosomal protein L11 methylase PrmA
MAKNNNFITRFYNESYNFLFKKLNNIKFDKSGNKNNLKQDIKYLEHSTVPSTAWLLNLKRLYNLSKKHVDIVNYHFLDVGCGNGIPLIYAYKKLKFKSYSGFDFVSRYTKISKYNIKSSIDKNKIKDLFVFESNAAEIDLDKNKSYFIFMFNPFDAMVMKKFLENNYETLKMTKSIISYSNYNQLDVIKNYSRNIKKIEKYKLAVIYF